MLLAKAAVKWVEFCEQSNLTRSCVWYSAACKVSTKWIRESLHPLPSTTTVERVCNSFCLLAVSTSVSAIGTIPFMDLDYFRRRILRVPHFSAKNQNTYMRHRQPSSSTTTIEHSAPAVYKQVSSHNCLLSSFQHAATEDTSPPHRLLGASYSGKCWQTVL